MPRAVMHPSVPAGLRQALLTRGDVDARAPNSTAGVVDELAAGAEILITASWDDRFLRPALRWVAGLGAGYEQYPVSRLERSDVALTTARGVHTAAVAEHTMGLLLGLTRRVADSVRNAAAQRWKQLPAAELAGATAVVAGLGTIGERVAELCRAFGMHVTGVKRDPHDYEGCADSVTSLDALVDACAAADVLISLLPGGPETQHSIGAAELEGLGEGWLINVGRGSVVDEPALIEALTVGRLRGAGLDVFEEEPLPSSSPLWELDNVVITPHIAGDGPSYVHRWLELFSENLEAMEGSASWRNRVVNGRVA